MKTNKMVLIAGLGIIAGSLAYISNFKSAPELHAGIGGTWSSDMKVQAMSVRNEGREAALVQLINSNQISEEQKSSLQSQYLSQVIMRKAVKYGSVNSQAFEEAVSEALANGIFSSSEFGQ